MKRRALALGFAALLAANGCSLVKLSDDIEQENCNSNADCDVLNKRDSKSFDPCDLWQCRPATKLCEKFALDEDHDGFTPATIEDDIMCEVAKDKQDCDDDSAKRKPGGKEACDDVDNDCDQSIDEGALLPKESAAVAFNGANIDGAGDVNYAVDPGTGDVAVAYSINRSPNNLLGFSVLKNDAPMGATASAVAPPPMRFLFADTAGVAALGAGKFAVAFFNRSGGGRLVAGVIDGNGSGERTFEATGDVMASGLRCADGEKCAMTTPDTQTPGLAAIGDDVLVAYLRAPSDPSQMCHAKGAAVPAHPLLANLLAADTTGLVEQTDAAVLIAEASALEAPAVVGIPASPGEVAFGWLVAYVDEVGAVVVRRVEADGSSLKVSPPLLTLNDAAHRHSNLRFTLGPKEEDDQLVGLAFQRGCTVAARVGAVVLRVGLDGSTAKVQQLGSPILVGDGAANETRPAIAYTADRKVWGVAYRDPSGLRARMFDQERNLLGDDAYTLLRTEKTGSDKRELLLSPALVPSRDGGWFFALSYSERAGATPHVIEAATLAGCGKSD
jgi:Putative metal-binding motif